MYTFTNSIIPDTICTRLLSKVYHVNSVAKFTKETEKFALEYMHAKRYAA